MDIAAFASFLALVIAWLVLPLRAPAAIAASREESPVATDVQTAPAVSAAA